MNTPKSVCITCGPIPAKLDSVKFITNRFKGGLAIKTAKYLLDEGFKVTIVKWEHTQLPLIIITHPNLMRVVDVNDVYDYYGYFADREDSTGFDAYVMAAAVANLAPVNPFEGKFPSHDYRPGDKFDIRFTIAPRAIDIIKKRNPRCCLIGYKLFDAATDEELIDIARHTLADAHANIIFANTPAEAKTRKLAVMPDNSVVPCTFEEHLELIKRAIDQEYFMTKPSMYGERDMTDYANDVDVQEALAIVRMYEKTFDGYGTVAIPVRNHGMIATTSRGHKGEDPVIVTGINENAKRIYTISRNGKLQKATLNAPALYMMKVQHPYNNEIIVHRHIDDPRYDKGPESKHRKMLEEYVFPGTYEEEIIIFEAAKGHTTIVEPFHGYLKALPVLPVDWNRYRELFPDKYFGIPEAMQKVIDAHKGRLTLELGAGATPTGTHVYDPYVRTDKAINLSMGEIGKYWFSLIFCKNAINYMTLDEIRDILRSSDAFIANTFLKPPKEPKITENEVSIYDPATGRIRHTLLLPDDTLMQHEFYAYTREDWESLGLTVTPYSRNSALIHKGIGL